MVQRQARISSFLLLVVLYAEAWHVALPTPNSQRVGQLKLGRSLSTRLSSDSWNGEVVSDTPGGKIQGCQIQPVGDSILEWEITIDGVEADLGKFSDAIYKKITSDAKNQRFQGFRPGTIPPHLEPTYRAFAMDECARETVLEAMQQNNIRPFEDARSNIEIENVCIPPPPKKKNKKKKKRKKATEQDDAIAAVVEEQVPQWLTFDNMKQAIDAGWKPGQSFSFIAKNVKGQKVKGDAEVQGATPLDLRY